jgi:hypothetical protein
MRYLVPILCLAVLLLAAAPARAQSRLTGVDPLNGKTGDVVSAAGENIEKPKVVELYLTDGAKDFKVQILEQTDALIKFKVPGTIKAGRYALMIKTGGPDPKLLEQPIKFTVDEQ